MKGPRAAAMQATLALDFFALFSVLGKAESARLMPRDAGAVSVHGRRRGAQGGGAKVPNRSFPLPRSCLERIRPLAALVGKAWGGGSSEVFPGDA